VTQQYKDTPVSINQEFWIYSKYTN